MVGSSPGDSVINVNVLSSIAANRTLKLATSTPVLTFAAARAQAQKELLGSVGIYNNTSILTGTSVNAVLQPTNLTDLDLSKSRAGDQILAASSALLMTAGVNGAGVNLLLSQISNDLADDGLLNNSTKYKTPVQTVLCAAASTDFAKVASNLNLIYGTTYVGTDLSQWVDTSGCVDQVIDKFKFSDSNGLVGAVSKSIAYVAGPDDVGKCFSVFSATTGSIAGLYYNGEATATVGTKLIKLGDKISIGLSAIAPGKYSGFIQRTPSALNGTCPTTVPTTDLTRLQKYTTVQINIDVKLSNQPHYIRLLNNGLFSISGNVLINNQNIAGSYVNIYTPQNNIISNITNSNARSTGGGYTDSIDVTQDGFTYFGSWGELSKLDASGKVIWKKTVPGADYSYLSVSPDGGVFAAGANNNGQFWGVTNANTITKYDAIGNISWNTQLPMKATLGVFFYGITATPDGG